MPNIGEVNKETSNTKEIKRTIGIKIICILVCLYSLFAFIGSIGPFLYASIISIADFGLSLGSWLLSNIMENAAPFILSLIKPTIYLFYFYLIFLIWNLKKNSLKTATILYATEFIVGLIGETIFVQRSLMESLDGMMLFLIWMIIPTIVIIYLFTKRNIFINEITYEETNTKLWYLFSILSGIIGGLIIHFEIRNVNKKMARNVLIVGLIITIIFIIYLSSVFAIFWFGIVGPGHPQNETSWYRGPEFLGTFNGAYIRSWDLKSNGELSFYLENLIDQEIHIKNISFKNKSKDIAFKELNLDLNGKEKSNFINVTTSLTGNKGNVFIIEVLINYCLARKLSEGISNCDKNYYYKSEGSISGQFS